MERDARQPWRPWVQDFTPEELINGWGSGQATDGSDLQDRQCWEGYLPLPRKAGQSPKTEQAQAGGGRSSAAESRNVSARCHMLVGTSVGRGEVA